MIAWLKQYKLFAAGAAVLVLMALSAAIAWRWQANSYGALLAEQGRAHETQLRLTAEANAAVILKQQTDRLVLEARLAALDTTSTEKLTHAQDENDRLRHEYSAADDERRRLRIEVILARNDAVVSATTSSSSLGDAASVELSGEAGRSVWDIRGGMIEDYSKIKYLQSYVCAIKADAPGC
ncbi:lysis system i-spanin subunit Rz [Stutzerimonas nitrititolerans]|uniref:lysis system i-spanin subunit Rz n=1 Tax=Stutzerimonas nitrititolerans TaxID=2482751 RepID=UPI0028ADF114|nr:lysis system i-spanin subunit Rz [Stutzerimonas nitrititolerans]